MLGSWNYKVPFFAVQGRPRQWQLLETPTRTTHGRRPLNSASGRRRTILGSTEHPTPRDRHLVCPVSGSTVPSGFSRKIFRRASRWRCKSGPGIVPEPILGQRASRRLLSDFGGRGGAIFGAGSRVEVLWISGKKSPRLFGAP